MYCRYDCDTMVNNVFAYGPDGKVFFAAINFPGRWADSSLTACFFSHLKSKIGSFKICVDQALPRSGDAYGTLVGPVTKRAMRHLHHDICDYLLWISNFYMFFARPVSGECMDFRVRSLVARSIFPVTWCNNVLCLKQLCSCTIFKQSTLEVIKLKWYLTPNMFTCRTFAAMTELLKFLFYYPLLIITFIRDNSNAAAVAVAPAAVLAATTTVTAGTGPTLASMIQQPFKGCLLCHHLSPLFARRFLQPLLFLLSSFSS